MAIGSGRIPVLPLDRLSRMLIIISSFFSVAALTLIIVGTATRFWYFNKDSTGANVYYNLFTQCVDFDINKTSICSDISRDTSFGLGTQHAAALLVVAICLLGCGMLVTIAMNFIVLTGLLLLTAPIVLFLATLFMVAAFAEGSRVTYYNGYSANLVQTSHVLTIFSACLISFASGRLHVRYDGLF